MPLLSDNAIETLTSLLPLAIVLVVGVLVMLLAKWVIGRLAAETENHFMQTLSLVGLSLLFVVSIILSLPVDEELRKQLLALLGVLITLMMAFSSTSFVANAMAGLMLRGVDNLHPGDFVRVGDQFGRVTERGLFHTEIQTIERDLTTLPNLFLVSNPVSVVRSSGTVISAEVSLGYDVSIDLIESELLRAAEETGLRDAFVYVEALGDFSISYRVAGFLDEVKQLLTFRSTLRRNVVNCLHAAGIEIVSPSFMNQRQLQAGHKFIHNGDSLAPDVDTSALRNRSPEALIFDKADSAERRAILDQRRQLLTQKITDLQAQLEAQSGNGRKRGTEEPAAAAEREAIEAELQNRIEILEKRLAFVDRTAAKLDLELDSKK